MRGELALSFSSSLGGSCFVHGSRLIRSSVPVLWELFADGSRFDRWALEGGRVDSVDASWPSPGSRIDYSIRLWPFRATGAAQVLAARPGHSLRYATSSGWEVSTETTLDLKAGARGTMVTADVVAPSDVMASMPGPTLCLLLERRTQATLWRIADMVEVRG